MCDCEKISKKNCEQKWIVKVKTSKGKIFYFTEGTYYNAELKICEITDLYFKRDTCITIYKNDTEPCILYSKSNYECHKIHCTKNIDLCKNSMIVVNFCCHEQSNFSCGIVPMIPEGEPRNLLTKNLTRSLTNPVGIVGAGLAGLTIAYRLMQAGIPSVIYEASNRIGGRAWTGQFPNGQIYEIGGEFIDTNQLEIIELVQEVGLELIVGRVDAYPEKFMVINYDLPGNPLVDYPLSEAFADYQIVFPRISSDALAAWPGIKFNPSNKKAQELDRINLNNYINDVCSILRPDRNGSKSKFGQLLKVSYNTEYGREVEYQSCLNLLFLMGFGSIDVFSLYGPSDEVYNIVGGTQKLTDKLAQIVTDSGLCEIKLNVPVTKIERINNQPKNPYRITADSVQYTHTQLSMTIPFQMYEYIDYSAAMFSPLKLYTIKNSKLGFSSKLNVQFNYNYWNTLGYNGAVFATTNPPPFNPLAERQVQSTWDVTYDQGGTTAVMCNFTGGEYAKTFPTSFLIANQGLRSQELRRVTDRFLSQMEAPYPGISTAFNYQTTGNVQNVASVNWSEYPWTRGAYTVFSTGQYAGGTGRLNPNGTSSPPGSVVPFAGTEQDPEPASVPKSQRNCHFAGEGTTIDWQGWLNGAVFTGNNIAAEIIQVYSP